MGTAGEVLIATSAPVSPADSPLHEYYPALPRLQWGGITWGPPFLDVGAIGDRALAFLCCSWGVQCKFLYLGMLGRRFVSGCWMKRFLGVCALKPCYANQHALPNPVSARSTSLSVQKRGGEVCRAQCCTHEGVSEVWGSLPVRKLWVHAHVWMHTTLWHPNKHTAFFSRNLSALNKKSFHRKVSSESFLLDSRCWFLLCIFLTCQLFINYVFK